METKKNELGSVTELGEWRIVKRSKTGACSGRNRCAGIFEPNLKTKQRTNAASEKLPEETKATTAILTLFEKFF